ncbi:C40 family peptidase [Xylanimonas oleitrophica]|uniref:C40 family peptidase n=1 Tax=Xylanimonas oleitrophica TaxID=2607479 RepID=UPI001FE9C714|nr:C40 family peptidase [Xylanimonas oleitrophica]
MGAIARKGAVAVAGSGVLLSIVAAPADAAVRTADAKALSTSTVDQLSKVARDALQAAPVVAVAPEAKVSVESVTAEGVVPVEVTPAPKPKPQAAPRHLAPEPAAIDEDEDDAPAPASAPSASGSAIVAIAMRYLGVPYQWGGSTPAGFDCSGFTSYVFAQAGITLPRSSSAQRYAGTVVSRAEAQPGDLIWSPGHIGIYAGDGMQVEAPSPGKSVTYRSIWQDDPTFIRVG